jgi:hypothetical protein
MMRVGFKRSSGIQASPPIAIALAGGRIVPRLGVM